MAVIVGLPMDPAENYGAGWFDLDGCFYPNPKWIPGEYSGWIHADTAEVLVAHRPFLKAKKFPPIKWSVPLKRYINSTGGDEWENVPDPYNILTRSGWIHYRSDGTFDVCDILYNKGSVNAEQFYSLQAMGLALKHRRRNYVEGILANLYETILDHDSRGLLDGLTRNNWYNPWGT